jgi:hypothetical protein
MLRRARGAAAVLGCIAGSGTGFERNGSAPLARAAFSRGFLDFKKVGAPASPRLFRPTVDYKGCEE